MKIVCEKCRQLVDEDSAFCKFCGAPTKGIKTISLSRKLPLNEIFNGVYKSLQANSEFNENQFAAKYESFKKYENREISDNEYFSMLVDVIFYSGFKASTVGMYLNQIHKNFPDYITVSNYNAVTIDKIKNDPLMIRNGAKIEACHHNAQKMKKIIKEHGSFKKYVDSFNPNENDVSLLKLKKALQSSFDFLGDKTVYHFMMDIGLNVLKPDRVIIRIFNRLGLIEDESDLEGAVRTGRAFSRATGFPIRFIDIIFVMYGQLNLSQMTSICSENDPKCHLCRVQQYCHYFKSLTS